MALSASCACLDCGEGVDMVVLGFETPEDRDAFIEQHEADTPGHNRWLTINGPDPRAVNDDGG